MSAAIIFPIILDADSFRGIVCEEVATVAWVFWAVFFLDETVFLFYIGDFLV